MLKGMLVTTVGALFTFVFMLLGETNATAPLAIVLLGIFIIVGGIIDAIRTRLPIRPTRRK